MKHASVAALILVVSCAANPGASSQVKAEESSTPKEELPTLRVESVSHQPKADAISASLRKANGYTFTGFVLVGFDKALPGNRSTRVKTSTETAFLRSLDACAYSIQLNSVEEGHGYEVKVFLRDGTTDHTLEEAQTCLMKHTVEIESLSLETRAFLNN